MHAEVPSTRMLFNCNWRATEPACTRCRLRWVPASLPHTSRATAGARIWQPLRGEPWAVRSLIVCDLDDNLICFASNLVIDAPRAARRAKPRAPHPRAAEPAWQATLRARRAAIARGDSAQISRILQHAARSTSSTACGMQNSSAIVRSGCVVTVDWSICPRSDRRNRATASAVLVKLHHGIEVETPSVSVSPCA